MHLETSLQLTYCYHSVANYCTNSITMSVYTSERHQLHTPTLLDPPPVASSKTSGASAATCDIISMIDCSPTEEPKYSL